MSTEDMETPESNAAFFNARVTGYEDHMRGVFESDTEFTHFYQVVSSPIEKTDEPLNILDLGCGTGLEIEALLQRVPNAQITGIDVSEKMLAQLRKRYRAHRDQITLLRDSYLTLPFGTEEYDFVLSVMTTHHLLQDTKRNLYKKIHKALKPGGKYVEGDSVTLPEKESQFIREYETELEKGAAAEEGHYHIDVPFSINTQRKLLLEAGFKEFELIWQKDRSAVWNIAVYVVSR
jgi:tRNA (cmo5U34)-methyltransferase